MAKDMYKHQEKVKLTCDQCGCEFSRYDSQNLKTYNNYCSLECEYSYEGIGSKYRKYSKELKESILRLSMDRPDISARKIAKIFGVSKDIPSNIIKQYGDRKPKKLISYNRDYFKVIDSEDKAYWLGFIYADGNISKSGNGKGSWSLDIALKASDYKHLEKFANDVGYKGDIKFRDVKLGDKIHKACRLILSSEDICNDLQRLGVFPNKSLTLTFPTEEQVSSEYVKDFIRGYFDGDGSLTVVDYVEIPRLISSVLGTHEFLEELLDSINIKKNLIKKDKRRVNVNNFYFSLSGERSRKFIHYLYGDARTYLTRKKDLYDIHLKDYYEQGGGGLNE